MMKKYSVYFALILLIAITFTGLEYSFASTANIELASQSDPVQVGTLTFFDVRESNQGNTDLNGDGDTTDAVLHMFDAVTGVTTHLGFAVSQQFRASDDFLVFSVHEANQNNTDLNGDSDTGDEVLHVFNVNTRTTTNVGIEGGIFRIDQDIVAFSILESREGNTDLNGDSDASDQVLHIFNAANSQTTNLGNASSTFDLGDSFIAFSVSEFSQGSTDLNGDTDTNDSVLHVYDVNTDTLTKIHIFFHVNLIPQMR